MCVETDRPLEGVKVLVVEDDPLGAKLLRIVLELAGAVVRVSSTAERASRRLRFFRARLVLVDLVLRDGTGFELLKELRPRVARGDLTIVVISSVNGPETARKVESLGCAAYYRKPIETATLAGSLARYLETS